MAKTLAIIAPFLRTAYNYNMHAASEESGLSCPEPTLAQQHMADECDINKLVERYLVPDDIPRTRAIPLQGDFEGITDFQSAMNVVRSAEEQFMAMTADVRARFDNDPHKFLAFAWNEKNLPEMREMGLLSPAAIDRLERAEAAARERQSALQRDAEAHRASTGGKPKGGNPDPT